MMPQITLDNVSKFFSQRGGVANELWTIAVADRGILESGEVKAAVKAVSLVIGQGERLGIVGSNGAGKSTLLHMIAQLSDPTIGTINIVGKVTSIMTLGIGLRDDLSGRQNIYVDGEIQGKTRSEVDDVIDEVIEFSELGEFIDYPVRTYSTGMKARLAFAMISHIDPEILIIDEALSVGDASFSAKATARILEICARGKIVILVSHSMESIKTICNRCLWMDDGRVIMDGSPDEVTKAYIDKVRGKDEAELLEKFRGHIGSRSFKPGYEIKELAWFCGEDREPRLLLEAGSVSVIHIQGLVGDAKESRVHVQIVRLDELLLFDEYLCVHKYLLKENFFAIEIEMNPLLLGAATYRLDVALELDSVTLAEASSVFEVYTLNAPKGGKPMLLYPLDVSVTHIQ
ncbi:MAG TPA: ABC transporter ATP-binding protein [Methylobacter sp.]|jgi:lipopolysaccharide transport system ATP-binding protein